MAKKVVKWYGINTFDQDLKVSEIEVERETEYRLYPTVKQQAKGVMWNMAFVYKTTGYEQWFPTREEAVQAKLKLLTASRRRKKEESDQNNRLIADFKKQENL
jgi:hypothetical protein